MGHGHDEYSRKQRIRFFFTCFVPLLMFVIALIGIEIIYFNSYWSLALGLFFPVTNFIIGVVKSYQDAKDTIEWVKEQNKPENRRVKNRHFVEKFDGSIEVLEILDDEIPLRKFSWYWWSSFKSRSVLFNTEGDPWY